MEVFERFFQELDVNNDRTLDFDELMVFFEKNGDSQSSPRSDGSSDQTLPSGDQAVPIEAEAAAAKAPREGVDEVLCIEGEKNTSPHATVEVTRQEIEKAAEQLRLEQEDFHRQLIMREAREASDMLGEQERRQEEEETNKQHMELSMKQQQQVVNQQQYMLQQQQQMLLQQRHLHRGGGTSADSVPAAPPAPPVSAGVSAEAARPEWHTTQMQWYRSQQRWYEEQEQLKSRKLERVRARNARQGGGRGAGGRDASRGIKGGRGEKGAASGDAQARQDAMDHVNQRASFAPAVKRLASLPKDVVQHQKLLSALQTHARAGRVAEATQAEAEIMRLGLHKLGEKVNLAHSLSAKGALLLREMATEVHHTPYSIHHT
jgi:hypothetical protein